MTMIKTITLLLSLVATLVKAQTGDCDLDCYFNTTCVPGDADFSEHPKRDGQPLDIHTKTVSKNGYHCDCPPGKTGLKCGRTYEGCSDRKHKCYNGGKCIPGVADEFGNEQEFCDCTDAVDNFGVKHVGKYCEVPVPVTCGDTDDVFCVNGGHCKEHFEDSPHRPCRCGTEHDGPHCEYMKGEVPECKITSCQNGHCKLGIKNYDMAEKHYAYFWRDASSLKFMHCACADGWHGPNCDVPSKECGDHHCFNGAKCVTVGTQISGGIVEHHCDCSSAHTKDKSYGGRYCQYEANHFCDKNVGPNGQTFCVNNGTCVLKDGIPGCECPQGYHGPICEFHDKEYNGDYEECTLRCLNDGTCRKGVKDVSYLDKYDLGPDASHLNQTHNEDFEHCLCPDGYTGHKCETKMEICGDASHVCLYGSTCIDNGNSFSCDCEGAFTEHDKYAGTHCQHKATSFCTLDGQPGAGDNALSFCVNNGICINPSDGGHNGCTCPDGFSGKHCEYATEQVQATSNGSTSSGGHDSKAGLAVGLTVCLLAVAAGVALGVRAHKKQMKLKKPMDAVEHAIPVESNLAPGKLNVRAEDDASLRLEPLDDITVNEDELENVEII